MNDNAVSLDEFWGVVTRLTGDASRCMTALEALPEDDEEGRAFWRRMYARAVFTAIDGATYRMTFHAHAARDRREVTFSMNELSRLEKAYDFDEDREEHVSTFSKSQMLDDIKFAFNAFARVHYSDYVLSINDPNWILIKEIAHIKSCLLYPREPQEVEVYEENIDTLVEGLLWFIQRVVELIEDCREHILEKFAEWEDKDEPVM